MSAMMKSTLLALCMLFVAGSTWGAQPDSLLGATALVVSADAVHSTLVLRVPSAGRKPLAFTVSPSCLFSDGLLSKDDLYPNERVLVWTVGGQAGTLPVIIRVARAVN